MKFMSIMSEVSESSELNTSLYFRIGDEFWWMFNDYWKVYYGRECDVVNSNGMNSMGNVVIYMNEMQ